MREIARHDRRALRLDVTLNRDQAASRGVFAGELFAEHAAACAHVQATAMRPVPAPFDVVLTTNSGYPLDQNLYQAVKGMSAAAESWGPAARSSAPPNAATASRRTARTARCCASQPAAEALLEMIERAGLRASPTSGRCRCRRRSSAKACVLVKTGGLSHEEVRAAHFSRSTTWASAVRDALRRAGPRGDAVRAAAGPQTIPYLKAAPLN